MEKRDVLVVTNSLCQGGAEHSLITTLRCLADADYQISLLVLEPKLDLLEQVPEGIEVILADVTARKRNFSIFLTAMKLLSKLCSVFAGKETNAALSNRIKQQEYIEKRARVVRQYVRKKYDVIVCNVLSTWATEIAAMIEADRHYLVYRISNDTHHEMLTRLLPSFDGVVAVSEEIKDRIRQWYPQYCGQITVIENMIDSSLVKQMAEKEPEHTLQAESKYRICSCGRLSHEKGFDLAVSAAAKLKALEEDFVWLFVGDGPERQNLEMQIAERGLEKNIVITGMMQNPFAIMNLCDVFVQPSYEESYGRTIKEAMILGKPVISTNTIGGRELLDGGQKGIIVDMDADQIAETLYSVLSDQGKRAKYSDLISTNELNQEKEQFIESWNKLLRD